MQVCKLQCCRMKSLNIIETPIFVLECDLSIQRQPLYLLLDVNKTNQARIKMRNSNTLANLCFCVLKCACPRNLYYICSCYTMQEYKEYLPNI